LVANLLIFLHGFQLFHPELSQRQVATAVVAGLALVRLEMELMDLWGGEKPWKFDHGVWWV
jgi:hypothetical protein